MPALPTPINPTLNSDNGGNGDISANGGDITAGLQSALSRSYTEQRHIQIPPGRYVLSDTVEAAHRTGLKLLGSGVAPDNNSSIMGVGTILVWEGTPGDPMIWMRGSHFDVGDFTLIGDGKSEGSVGLQVAHPAGFSGVGTGQGRIRRIRVEDLGTGIRFGQVGGDNLNGDLTSIDWLRSENCARAVHLVHENSMGYWIKEGMSDDCTDFCYVDAGGHIKISNVTFGYGATCALRITGNGDVGNNNGQFILENIKVDNQVGNNFQMVHSAETSEHRIIVRECLISPDSFVGNFATITGQCVLVIRDSSGSFKTITGSTATVGGSVKTPQVLVDGALIEGVDLSAVFQGDLDYRILNCTKQGGGWWPDTPARNIYIDSELFSPASGAIGDIVVY